MRTYSELTQLETLEDRFDYLNLQGVVGDLTFGNNRWMNQVFYRSKEWRDLRKYIIVRDQGFEMGVHGWPVRGHPTIHHLNPITVEEVMDRADCLLDPENLISVSHRIHNAIHYGNKEQLPRPFAERTPGDTRIW